MLFNARDAPVERSVTVVTCGALTGHLQERYYAGVIFVTSLWSTYVYKPAIRPHNRVDREIASMVEEACCNSSAGKKI